MPLPFNLPPQWVFRRPNGFARPSKSEKNDGKIGENHGNIWEKWSRSQLDPNKARMSPGSKSLAHTELDALWRGTFFGCFGSDESFLKFEFCADTKQQRLMWPPAGQWKSGGIETGPGPLSRLPQWQPADSHPKLDCTAMLCYQKI